MYSVIIATFCTSYESTYCISMSCYILYNRERISRSISKSDKTQQQSYEFILRAGVRRMYCYRLLRECTQQNSIFNATIKNNDQWLEWPPFLRKHSDNSNDINIRPIRLSSHYEQQLFEIRWHLLLKDLELIINDDPPREPRYHRTYLVFYVERYVVPVKYLFSSIFWSMVISSHNSQFIERTYRYRIRYCIISTIPVPEPWYSLLSFPRYVVDSSSSLG